MTLGKTLGPVDAPRSNLHIPIRSQLQECSRAIACYMNLNCLHSLTGQSDPSSIFKLTHVGTCAESRLNQENGPKSPDPYPSIWWWVLWMRLLSTWKWINEYEGLGPYQVKPEHIHVRVYISGMSIPYLSIYFAAEISPNTQPANIHVVLNHHLYNTYWTGCKLFIYSQLP